MPAQPLTHVFVLMLENRSFDHMFAFSGIAGITAATTRTTNTYQGVDYPQRLGASARMPTDPGHEFGDVLEQLAGGGAVYPPGGPYPRIDNSGFVSNYATTTSEGPLPRPGDFGDVMACFDTPTQLPVICQLAKEFVLCDHWFSSMPGPTWPNRFFAHGASSAGLDHSPTTEQIADWEGDHFGGFIFPNGSIFDALTRANVPWRIYHDTRGPLVGAIPQVSSIKGVSYLSARPISRFAGDLLKPYPYGYTFIEPNYGDIANGSYTGGSSQHPMDEVAAGETLIKTVYEAIRNSPVWPQSLLIITYDEHGGFFDSVPPGPAPAPADGASGKYNQFGFTFDRYGVRVPAIVVSPLIPQPKVEHRIYDHASIPATLERLFGLPPLTDRDRKANDVLGLLAPGTTRACSLQLPPPALPTGLTFKVAPSPHSLDEPISAPGNLAGMAGVMLKTELELSSGSAAEKKAILADFKAIKTRAQAQAYIERIGAQAKAVRDLAGGTTGSAGGPA